MRVRSWELHHRARLIVLYRSPNALAKPTRKTNSPPPVSEAPVHRGDVGRRPHIADTLSQPMAAGLSAAQQLDDEVAVLAAIDGLVGPHLYYGKARDGLNKTRVTGEAGVSQPVVGR